MPIAPGASIPDATVLTPTEAGPKPVRTSEALGKGMVVLFAVPGAFTPTCSDYHLPGFVLRADDLRAQGVERIACVAVNDAFVLDAWAKSHGVGDTITMLADGNGDFTRAMGLELDLHEAGLGIRSRRYAAIIRDGVIQELMIESGTGLEASSADRVLERLAHMAR
jgi:peroxiredoxin